MIDEESQVGNINYTSEIVVDVTGRTDTEVSYLRGRLGYTLKAIRPSSGLAYCFGGAFMGPFLGVWLSLVAVKMIPAGISSTLNADTHYPGCHIFL